MIQPRNQDTQFYVDVSGTSIPSYALMGEGINSVTPSNNPSVSTTHYINHANPTNDIVAIAMQFAVAGEKVVGDEVNEFLCGLEGKIGEDCETTLVRVNTWETEVSGAYPATKYDISIALNNSGTVQGGATQAIDATIYVNGDPIQGTFNTSTKTWTDATP